jgi:glycosyltransferase involved in cell wall biosynthesis
MSSGMPIICSNHSSLPELLLNGGLYFNPNSILEISTNLEKIILNKNLRIELSNNSKNISKNYTWEKCSKETFEFLESFI